jgi:hypothetical protein
MANGSLTLNITGTTVGADSIVTGRAGAFGTIGTRDLYPLTCG